MQFAGVFPMAYPGKEHCIKKVYLQKVPNIYMGNWETIFFGGEYV